MRMSLIGAAATLLASIPAQADQHMGSETRVPFVGCRSDGQLGPQAAPKSRDTPTLPTNVALQLAFYGSSDGPGVLAPRGWHCFGVYGSNGSGLVVAPERLTSDEFFGRRQFSTKGSAVELAYDYGGTSGRWAVANAIARYSPHHRDFVGQNFQDLDVGPLPSGPYPHDIISKHTDTLVRYTTPPSTKGAGTVWVLAPSTEPINGLVLLVNDPDGPDVLRVSIRLSDSFRPLAPVILDEAERQAR